LQILEDEYAKATATIGDLRSQIDRLEESDSELEEVKASYINTKLEN
jgi:hypothetical protein